MSYLISDNEIKNLFGSGIRSAYRGGDGNAKPNETQVPEQTTSVIPAAAIGAEQVPQQVPDSRENLITTPELIGTTQQKETPELIETTQPKETIDGYEEDFEEDNTIVSPPVAQAPALAPALAPAPTTAPELTPESVGSPTDNVHIEEVVDALKTCPSLTNTYYHIALDTGFSKFVKGKDYKSSRSDGKMEIVSSGKVEEKAKEMINSILSGDKSINGEAYHGVIAIGMKFPPDKVTCGKVEGKTDIYLDDTSDHGFINRKAYDLAILESAKYYTNDYLWMLQMKKNGKIDDDDIPVLQCLHTGCDFRKPETTLPIQPVAPEITPQAIETKVGPTISLGGRYSDFRDLYTIEKAIYLSRKNKMSGGAQQVDYEQLYKQKKMEYLRLKAQKQQGGGEPNWEQLYKQKKMEYLSLKAQKQQGGGVVDYNQLYRQKKAEYLELKAKLSNL